MLFHSQLTPGSGTHIEQLVVTLDESLHVELFQHAWEQVIDRHDALRSSCDVRSNRESTQHVHEHVDIHWTVLDWTTIPKELQASQFSKYLNADRLRDFDVAHPPLFRLALIRTGTDRYEFIWTFHHVLCDGRSIAIVLSEAFELYQALIEGRTTSMGRARAYRDYVDAIQAIDHRESKTFWSEHLRGFTNPTPLITPRASRDLQSAPGHDRYEVSLSRDLTDSLRAFARQKNVTFNTLIQGAWGFLLAHYSGETDVVFGATRACRSSFPFDARSLVGLLINTVPVRTQIDSNTRIVDWLQQLRTQPRRSSPV